MRPDPEDESTVWMHTGDEGIIDEEGYLRSTSMARMSMRDADPSCCSCWSNQGLFLMCLRYRINDMVLGHHHSWWRGELLSNNACGVHDPSFY